jgi:hypothetical protein
MVVGALDSACTIHARGALSVVELGIDLGAVRSDGAGGAKVSQRPPG